MALTLSDILDAADGLLTEAQKGQLVTTLLDTQVKQVQPGDLITAGLFNQMLANIADLAVRVSALEGAGEMRAPVITGITPNPATVGGDMTIIGENLAAKFLTSIDVGDSRIATGLLKAGSSPTQLIFSTPGVTGATPTGVPVIVRVANDAGEAQSACVIRSGVAANLAASFGPVLTGVTPAGDLAINTDYTFAFDVSVESSHLETFTVTPQLNVSPSAGWTIAMASGAQFSAPVTAGTPVTRQFTVALHTGGDANTTGSFTLEFAGTSFPAFKRSSMGFPVAINDTTQPTDGPIQFQAPTITGDPTKKTFKDGDILVTKDLITNGTATTKTVRLTVPLTIDATGAAATYDVAVATDPPQSGATPDWAIVRTSAAQIQQSAGGANLAPVTATINAAGINSAATTLVVSVIGAGALPDATLRLGLRVVDTIQ